MFWYMYSEALCCKSLILNDFLKLAEWTGLEPATPGVTGRYSNQLNYHSRLACSESLARTSKTDRLLRTLCKQQTLTIK